MVKKVLKFLRISITESSSVFCICFLLVFSFFDAKGQDDTHELVVDTCLEITQHEFDSMILMYAVYLGRNEIELDDERALTLIRLYNTTLIVPTAHRISAQIYRKLFPKHEMKIIELFNCGYGRGGVYCQKYDLYIGHTLNEIACKARYTIVDEKQASGVPPQK